MNLLDRIPYSLLIIAAIFMLGAPFLPEPHLVEKARMFAEGRLSRPLDIFDVFWHRSGLNQHPTTAPQDSVASFPEISER